MAKTVLLATLVCFVLVLAGCSSSPNDGAVTVNGVSYDDEHWNGR